MDDIVYEAPLTPDTLPIGLRRSLVADEYFWLKAMTLESSVPRAFREALEAMRELHDELAPDATAWEDLDVPLGTVRRASELRLVYARLPVTREIGGKSVPIRAHAMRLARELEATEEAYRVGPYVGHEVEIQRAAKELNAQLLPRIDEVMRTVAVDLALSGLSRPIVVTLVADAPYSGAFAADARGLATASFVRVGGLSGSALCESVLHEALHAIDELTVRSSTAMNELRATFEKRGFELSDPAVEMAINTVMFAEAASLVRRFVNPAHVPLGEGGFYAWFSPAPRITKAWAAHLQGASLEVTADEIAAAVSEP